MRPRAFRCSQNWTRTSPRIDGPYRLACTWISFGWFHPGPRIKGKSIDRGSLGDLLLYSAHFFVTQIAKCSVGGSENGGKCPPQPETTADVRSRGHISRSLGIGRIVNVPRRISSHRCGLTRIRWRGGVVRVLSVGSERIARIARLRISEPANPWTPFQRTSFSVDPGEDPAYLNPLGSI